MDKNKARAAYENMTNRKMNCSQAVFSSFSEDLGLKRDLALSIAQGFGGGMYVGGVCGAVTGAYMTLGLANPAAQDNPRASMDKINALIAEFNRKFKELYGSINCTELLGYDLTKLGEAAKAREKGLFVTKCPNFVSDAVKTVENLLKLK